MNQLLKSEKGRYLVIGGTVYLLELGIIIALEKTGTSPVVAVGVAFSIGTAVSFLLQKLVTFRDKRLHHAVLLPQILATGLLIAWNLLFSMLMTHLLQDYLPATVTRTGVLLITTIWNFYLYKTHIFTTEKPPIA